MRLLAILTVLFFSSIGISTQAQDRQDELSQRIDSIFSPYARSDAPGCVVAVMKSGQIQYAQAYGMADVALGVPLTTQTTFSIASSTKPFTALAILLLEQDGKLTLEDDVRRYVPEMPDFGQPITVRMLLNHTSGLRELGNLFILAGWRNTDVQLKEDVIAMIKRQRALNHPPGAEFAYNSTGYTFLALIVERISGVSFRRFVVDRIFNPLGMTNSEVRERVSQVIARRATGYWGHNPAELRTGQPANSFAGPNGVVTSVEDLAKWDANFYDPRVGTQAMLNKMSVPGRLADGSEFGYGLGFFIGTHRGLRMISHAGSDLGYKSEFIRFPSERLTVTVLCNAFDIAPTPLALQVADLYLPKSPAPAAALPTPSVAPDQPKENPAAFAGLYWDDAMMQASRFFYDNGKLFIDGGGEGNFELRPLGNNSYRLTAAPRRYVFTFVQSNRGLKVIVDREGSRLRELRRVPDKKPTITTLRRLEGRYYSPELDVVWTFVLRDRKLLLERQWTEPSEMSPVFGTAFLAPDGFALEFQMDRVAREMAIHVSTERARKIRFIRLREGQTR